MELRGIHEESSQRCIDAWQRKMDKCIRLEREYFEGVTCRVLLEIEIKCLSHLSPYVCSFVCARACVWREK